MNKVVLITGCSTGIGRELVGRLTQAEYKVIATARSIETLKDLNAALKLSLDVTEGESIQQAVKKSMEKFGRIDFLINNAGYAQVGAVEELTDNQIQNMYDVNVFGVVRMIRAVAPIMRKQKEGQIINISSISGKLVTPINGCYSSSKFALEAISDALRHELRLFNVKVIVVEPGAIRTSFDQTVHKYGDATLSNPLSPYLSLYQKYTQVSEGMRGNEPGPEAVCDVIQKVLKMKNPKPRYLAGFPFPGSAVIFLRDLVWDTAVTQMFRS